MAKTSKSVGRKWLVCLLLLGTMGATAHAQKLKSISVALQTESIAFPFTRLSPMHPGIELGVTLGEKEKPKSTRRWNAYLGWFYHKNIDQNFYVRGEYQFAYDIKNTIGINVPVGLGYMHTFNSQPVFEQQDNGSFERKTQLGNARVIVNLGLGLSYLKLDKVEPFIKYEVVAQSPFVATVPVGVRSFLKIGTTIKLK